jgi:glycosyltransferase involved in cell wall biosynthesis
MIVKMKDVIQNIFYIFNLRLTKNYKIYKLQKNNVFKSHYDKKVLISYITKPFAIGMSYEHSNLLECYTAAEIFHNLGFCVDVVEHSINRKIDYSQYEIIYGMGPALERSFYSQEGTGPYRIFYATGCNPIYSDVVTTLRARDFYEKHKRLLMKSVRIVLQSQHAQILLADTVIVLGNEFVLNTYKNYDPDGVERYTRLNAFYNDVYDINLENKDYSNAKRHYLWFGSGGLLHKGLDILLDIFSQRNDVYLHICGAFMQERGFLDYYKRLFSNSNNIINHGFVKMESEDFKILMDTCGYVLSPSVSEGGAVALLNTMANGGLVPIITKSSGLDMEDYGWVIEKHDINMFNNAIDQAVLLDNKKLKEKAIRVKAYVRHNYIYENYKQNLYMMIQNKLKTQ